MGIVSAFELPQKGQVIVEVKTGSIRSLTMDLSIWLMLFDATLRSRHINSTLEKPADRHSEIRRFAVDPPLVPYIARKNPTATMAPRIVPVM